MKSIFSKSWNASKQPRKQIKFRANAPHHIRRTFMTSPLDKTLQNKHGIRSIEVRTGDDVKIMRGKFAKKQGKVSVVDVSRSRIQVEGVQRSKQGGEKVETWFHPSKVKIIKLEGSDSRRLKHARKTEPKPVKAEVVGEEIETSKIKETKSEKK